jgi:hypothetical protein
MRTKGALNRRTRAALTAAAEGKLADAGEQTISYLLKVANDPNRDDAVRMQAANAALPYVKPRLASIEQTNLDPRDQIPESEIIAKLQALLQQSPELLEQMVSLGVAVHPELCDRLLKLLRGPDGKGTAPLGNAILTEGERVH